MIPQRYFFVKWHILWVSPAMSVKMHKNAFEDFRIIIIDNHLII